MDVDKRGKLFCFLLEISPPYTIGLLFALIDHIVGEIIAGCLIISGIIKRRTVTVPTLVLYYDNHEPMLITEQIGGPRM